MLVVGIKHSIDEAKQEMKEKNQLMTPACHEAHQAIICHDTAEKIEQIVNKRLLPLVQSSIDLSTLLQGFGRPHFTQLVLKQVLGVNKVVLEETIEKASEGIEELKYLLNNYTLE